MNIDSVKKIAVPILKKAGVFRAGVFGSVARETNNDNSDIDLLVELDKDKSIFAFSALKLELEEALRTKVDLVEYHYIKPGLEESILTSEVRIL